MRQLQFCNFICCALSERFLKNAATQMNTINKWSCAIEMFLMTSLYAPLHPPPPSPVNNRACCVLFCALVGARQIFSSHAWCLGASWTSTVTFHLLEQGRGISRSYHQARGTQSWLAPPCGPEQNVILSKALRQRCTTRADWVDFGNLASEEAVQPQCWISSGTRSPLVNS